MIRCIKIFLFVFCPFLILFLLGTWQLLRMHYKESVIRNMASQPINLPYDNLLQYNYRNVKLDGSFVSKKVFFVFVKNDLYYLLQPFLLKNTGNYILVNRGLVYSTNHGSYDLVRETSVSVEGTLYCDRGERVSWIVKNDEINNLWFWFDIDSMSSLANIRFGPCIVWAHVIENPVVIHPNFPVKIFNKHLEYVITWYVLSIAWLSIFFWKSFRSFK